MDLWYGFWWFRNPARKPVEVGSFSHYLQGFSTIPGGCLGFLPSTVGFWWRLFHVDVEKFVVLPWKVDSEEYTIGHIESMYMLICL